MFVKAGWCPVDAFLWLTEFSSSTLRVPLASGLFVRARLDSDLEWTCSEQTEEASLISECSCSSKKPSKLLKVEKEQRVRKDWNITAKHFEAGEEIFNENRCVEALNVFQGDGQLDWGFPKATSHIWNSPAAVNSIWQQPKKPVDLSESVYFKVRVLFCGLATESRSCWESACWPSEGSLQ